MKTIVSSVIALPTLFGLILAGGETTTPDIGSQLLLSSGGLALFALGLLSLWLINRTRD